MSDLGKNIKNFVNENFSAMTRRKRTRQQKTLTKLPEERAVPLSLAELDLWRI